MLSVQENLLTHKLCRWKFGDIECLFPHSVPCALFSFADFVTQQLHHRIWHLSIHPLTRMLQDLGTLHLQLRTHNVGAIQGT